MRGFGYAFLFALAIACFAQAQSHPRPPGLQQADQAEAQAQASIPPSTVARPKAIDAVKLQSEADDLARIAQTIPADVSSIQHGELPKDFLEKLKEIEKLSKRLRAQIKGQ
jgi:hypothetical protein